MGFLRAGNVSEQIKRNSQDIKIKLNEKTEKGTELVQARPEFWRGGVERMKTAE